MICRSFSLATSCAQNTSPSGVASAIRARSRRHGRRACLGTRLRDACPTAHRPLSSRRAVRSLFLSAHSRPRRATAGQPSSISPPSSPTQEGVATSGMEGADAEREPTDRAGTSVKVCTPPSSCSRLPSFCVRLVPVAYRAEQPAYPALAIDIVQPATFSRVGG